MKFRISKKDLINFLMFSGLLLYLCAIGILNLAEFGNNGVMHGLNPIPAFFGDYLPVTLIVYLILLVVIFSSVSSVIFDKEKGKGVGIKVGDKVETGYSKWASEKDIKEDSDVEKVLPNDDKMASAGIPLINNGKEIYVDNGQYHSLIIGSTGSGKTQTIVKPMVNILAKKGESMIITDPKGELYMATGEILKAQGYKIVLLNFREPQKGNAWNPLFLPYEYYKEGNADKSIELLDDVALNILYDPNNKGEPFWEKSAADYFSGLALGLFLDAKRDEVNLNSINYMSTVGEEKFAGGNFIKEYFNFKGPDSNAYTFASGTINAPNDTKGGILSTFKQKIRLFSTRENLSEMLSHSDFDMRSIGKEKTAVFILIHDEKTTYHSLATIFIKQCYETLIDVAQENGGKLNYRTNFILDEFANMPPLKDVTTMVTAARSREIRFNFIIQNIAQLKQVYGPENADTIRGNCGNIIYLISTELSALEEISKMCGELKSKKDDKTVSTPLVSITDLQKLKLFEAIIMRLRKPPFKTKYTPDFKMNWGHNFGDATFPNREKKPVALFDLKNYVKEKKREKLMESINNPGENGMPKTGMDDAMFGGMSSRFGNNPFASNQNPFASNQNPFASNQNPFLGNNLNNRNPLSANNPFAGNNNPFNSNMNNNPFAGNNNPFNSNMNNNPFAGNNNPFNSNGMGNENLMNNNVNPFNNTGGNQMMETPDSKLIENIEKRLSDYVAKNKLNQQNEVVVNNSREKEIFDSIKAKEEVKNNIPNEVVETSVKESIKNDIPTKPALNIYEEFENKKASNVKQINMFDEPVKKDVVPDKIEMVEKQEIVKEKVQNVPTTITSEVTEGNKKINEVELPKPKILEDKPKVNIDVDSVIVNENMNSDDAYFDDFFGEDE